MSKESKVKGQLYQAKFRWDPNPVRDLIRFSSRRKDPDPFFPQRWDPDSVF